MKCNYRRIGQLNPSERKKLADEVKGWNEKFLEEQLIKQRKEITNNSLQLLVIATNKALGIGAGRMEKVLVELNNLMKNCDDKDDFWLITNQDCKKILGEEMYYKYFTDWELENLNFGGMITE